MVDLHAREFDNCCKENKGFYADDLYVWNGEARYYDRAIFDKSQSEKTRRKFA